MSMREFSLALDLHTEAKMANEGFQAYWAAGLREIAWRGQLVDYWTQISSGGIP